MWVSQEGYDAAAPRGGGGGQTKSIYIFTDEYRKLGSMSLIDVSINLGVKNIEARVASSDEPERRNLVREEQGYSDFTGDGKPLEQTNSCEA